MSSEGSVGVMRTGNERRRGGWVVEDGERDGQASGDSGGRHHVTRSKPAMSRKTEFEV